RAATVDEVLAILLRGARPAVVWNRLLQLGARYPKEIGRRILALARVPVFMWAFDTEDAAAAFIAALFPILKSEERQEVENAILALPNAVPEKMRAVAERDRDQLILSLGNNLVTEDATRLLSELQAAQATQKPRHQGPRFQVTSAVLDDKTYLE